MMMIRRIFSLLVVIGGITGFVTAQQKMTLDEAIQIGLKNNFDILTAQSQDAIFSNNVYIGNAGMLPYISLNGSMIKTFADTKFNYSTGESVNKSNAQSTALNAYAELDWTLFDGLKMFATYNKLKVL